MRLPPVSFCVLCLALATVVPAVAATPSSVVALDGDDWLLAPDPKNVGRDERWFDAPRPEAKKTKVPWIIQDAWPGYHGVAWYWKDFHAAANDRPGGRTWLRFWAVDYKADVWLNGQPLGSHEGGESPFTLDATAAIRPGANRLAIRVLNPIHTPIDGIVLNETAHRNKALPYSSGSAWNQGGIIDSVELLATSAARIDDLFVRADPKSGMVRVQATLRNAGGAAAAGRLAVAIAPAASGGTIAERRLEVSLAPGDVVVETALTVPQPRLWNLDDPFLYRVTARLETDSPPGLDETSARCGFRELRFEKGAFRLNGRRIYLRCSHTGNCCPIGLEMPHDPDFLRRDLVNAKAMRFNVIRFISGVAKRYQLDLCDELGLMVYEEAYASWCLADSPRMGARFDESILGMVRRDRNHPSVTFWGLLNETPDGPVFRHAAALLPTLRKLDDSRIVMLNSGRWDAQGGSVTGIEIWRNASRSDPCVTRNSTDKPIRALGITWQPGQLAFHPGRDGEYAAVRWTAPADGPAAVTVDFESIAERATTDVHVLLNGKSLSRAGINVGEGGPKARFQAPVETRRGDRLDFVVGFGNGSYGADTTALDVTIVHGGKTYRAARDFDVRANPNGVWSYGQMPPAPAPRAESFVAFGQGRPEDAVGTLSNPGSNVWEDVLADTHPYQRVPHTAEVVRTLRTHHGNGQPVFLSEYGIGSATDLLRVVRHYEQAGKPEVEDAQLYRQWRDQYLADYRRWKLDEAFGRPEEFFAQSVARMAEQRLLGLNAIRSNPNIIGHSMTGTVDQGMTAEGLWTTFRELKPGTVDAVFDGWAPLRWCLFAEPVNVWRKAPVKLEAVLANEDALRPGKYRARFQAFGPGAARVWERAVEVTIPPPGKAEPSMVLAVLAEDVTIDGPPGKYRFVATFEEGAAAAGGEAVFHLYDRSESPAVTPTEVVAWGDDPELARWLGEQGIAVRAYSAAAVATRAAIVASAAPPAPGDAAVWADLARRIGRGSSVVFLSPSVFAKKDQPTGWLPLANKGTIAGLPSWLYHKDEWCKRHLVFAGLPAPGLMDYAVYREVIPDHAFIGQDPPDEAICGGINASQAYSSGLMVSSHRLGAGRFLLNALRIRENLGKDPVAERLLRNMLRWAAEDAGKPSADLPADFDQQLQARGLL